MGKRWLKILVAVALLTWLFQQSGVQSTLANLQTLNYWAVAQGVWLLVVAQTLSGWRWQLLGKPLGFKQPVTAYTAWYLQGMFASLFLPGAAGGDVIKALSAAKAEGAKKRLAIGTVLADRVVGFSALVFLLFVWSFLPAASALPQFALWVCYSLTLMCALFAVAWLALPWPQWLMQLQSQQVQSLAKPASPQANPKALPKGLKGWFASRWHSLLNSLVNHLLGLLAFTGWRSVKGWGLPLLISVLSHGVMVVLHCILSASLYQSTSGLHLGWEPLALAYGLSSIMAVLPVSFNGTGLREGTYLAVLTPFGLSSSQALALALAYLMVNTLVCLLGGVCWLFERKNHSAKGETKYIAG